MNIRICYWFIAIVLRLLVDIATGRHPLQCLIDRAGALADECEKEYPFYDEKEPHD